MRYLTIILSIMLVSLLYQLCIGDGSWTKVHHLKQEKQLQIDENELLKKRNISLNAELLELKNGFEAIEERARFKMGMIKKDETFYQLVERP